VPLLDAEGEVEFLVFALRDVTERKRTEDQLLSANLALQQQTRQLRHLASELTQTEERERRRLAQTLHDHLQQLLVGARFGVEVLRRRAQTGELVQAVGHVDELLEEAIEASRSLTYELSPPILYEAGLIPALKWLARWTEEKHGLAVRLQAEDDTCDPESQETRVLLFQAVRELLFNVVKHAKVRTACLTVTSRGDQSIQIVVADNGVGFDPQALKTADGSFGGYGLFSIRERLGLLGGRLEIHSAPGQGSRFTLLAPLRPPAGPGIESGPAGGSQTSEAQSATAELDQAPDVSRKIRVLLADDHQVMRRGLARLLQEELDIEVVGEADDGRTAVELARQTLPDVIVMDVSMPRMNGIEATRILSTDLPDIRVIGLSMYGEADRAQAMRDAGAVAYLNKCDPSEDLIAAIRG
jgi:CheY-like chemotaxis protein